MAVPENYLKVVDLEFYYPKSLQSDVPVNKTESGKLDAIEMLYSNASLNLYPTYPSTDTDYYNVTVGDNNARSNFTATVKVLVPSSFKDDLSLHAGGMMRLRNYDSNSDWTYRAQARGLITKLPGFFFSDRQLTQRGDIITSMD